MADFARYCGLFQRLSKHRSFPSGWVSRQSGGSGAGTHYAVGWQTRQRDLPGLKARIAMQQTNISVVDGVITTSSTSFPIELQSVKFYVPSPNGNMVCVVRSNKLEKTSEDTIEIWSRTGLVTQKATGKVHGELYSDGTIGSISWDANGSKIVYVAEEQKPKNAHFFDEASDLGTIPLNQRSDFYKYQQDWGEQMPKTFNSRIFVFDIQSSNIQSYPKLSTDHVYGQPIFSKDGESIVFVGWEITPRRYGLRYCENRPAKIFKMAASGENEAVVISPKESQFNFDPRFSPNGKKLLFLSVKNPNAHASNTAAHILDWESGETRVLVDYVANPDSVGSFPGLYFAHPEGNPWINDKQIVLTSRWGFNHSLLLINAENGAVKSIGDSEYSWRLVHTLPSTQEEPGLILLAKSKLSEPPSLDVASIPVSGLESIVTTPLVESQPDELVNKLTHEVIPFYAEGHTEGPESYFEGLLLHAHPDHASDKLVVFPHGGPHSSFAKDYFTALAFLGCLGYNVLLVNYRGSLGYGSGHLEALIGHVGDRDVKDVFQAMQGVIKSKGFNPEKVVVVGGSHGGFLGAHLLGQYPTAFKGAVLRNPVINVTSMIGSTDIPDWCFHVNGFNTNQLLTPEAIDKLYESSPIRWAHQIQSPLFLMIGSQDKRVPPEQSIQLYHYLKTQNKDVRMVVYPEDCHELGRVDTESDMWVNIAGFFDEVLQSAKETATPAKTE